MNLRAEGKTFEYVNTGAWAKKAISDAKKVGPTRVVWTDEANKFTRMPKAAELKAGADAAYLHVTSNETIGGIEFSEFPDTGSVPLVADMSSDILSRPVPFARFALIYAGAQKNLGPAGNTVVIIRKDVLEKCREDMPAYLGLQEPRAGQVDVQHARRVRDLHDEAQPGLGEVRGRPGGDGQAREPARGHPLHGHRRLGRLVPLPGGRRRPARG